MMKNGKLFDGLKFYPSWKFTLSMGNFWYPWEGNPSSCSPYCPVEPYIIHILVYIFGTLPRVPNFSLWNLQKIAFAVNQPLTTLFLADHPTYTHPGISIFEVDRGMNVKKPSTWHPWRVLRFDGEEMGWTWTSQTLICSGLWHNPHITV